MVGGPDRFVGPQRKETCGLMRPRAQSTPASAVSLRTCMLRFLPSGPRCIILSSEKHLCIQGKGNVLGTGLYWGVRKFIELGYWWLTFSQIFCTEFEPYLRNWLNFVEHSRVLDRWYAYYETSGVSLRSSLPSNFLWPTFSTSKLTYAVSFVSSGLWRWSIC